MTINNSTSNTSSLANLIRSRQTLTLAAPDSNDCRYQISRVVRDIESPAVREIVNVVFDDLLRLLECLDMIEVHLRKVDSAEQTFALFQLIHDDAHALVDFMQTEALRTEAVTGELFDTLDGISFAVTHDLQRVFETNPSPSGERSKTHAITGRLYRAHDVLTNCLQQSTITLAMVFDPELNGAKLFNNSDMRFRQSLELCEDLAQLIQLVEAAEKNQAVFGPLSEGIQKFRNESMELLMYSDWPQFENLCEQIDPQREGQQLDAVLHQFRCYLETLLGQVRMRAVLANVFPLGFGDQRFSPARAESAPHYEHSDLNNFALAI
ncbi:MAG TPA: hypothetical protein VN951_16120 [Pyrinomonadaceae bacterium]|nr:hypothetical protein [Pyrinomonadaceae bacterium]